MPKAPKQPETPPTSLGKILTVNNVAAAAVLAVLGYAYATYDKAGDKASTTQVVPQSNTATPEVQADKDAKILDLRIPQTALPQFKLAGFTAQFEPSQFVPKIPPEKMKQISAKFTERVKTYFQSTSIPELEKAGNDIIATRKINSALFKEIENFFQTQGPEVRRTFEEAQGTGDPVLQLLFINNFLLLQNMMLTNQKDQYNRFAFYNLSPVEKFQNGVMEEPGQKTVVPIFFLKPALLDQSKIPLEMRRIPIQVDPITGIVFYCAEDQKAIMMRSRPSTEIRKALPQFPDEETMDLNSFNAVMQHEAMHKFLFDLNEDDKGRIEMECRDFVNVSITLANGKKIMIKGNYHPAAFHELAANGAELAAVTESDIYTELAFLDSKFDKHSPDSYALVRLFVESAFAKPGVNSWEAAMKSSVQEIQAVGRQMYAAGTFLLKNRTKVQ